MEGRAWGDTVSVPRDTFDRQQCGMEGGIYESAADPDRDELY